MSSGKQTSDIVATFREPYASIAALRIKEYKNDSSNRREILAPWYQRSAIPL